MSPLVEPQHSVILVVGREQFTPPETFGGEACTASHDCVAIGVRTVEDGPTDVTIWGNTDSEPSEVLVQVAVSEETWLDAP